MAGPRAGGGTAPGPGGAPERRTPRVCSADRGRRGPGRAPKRTEGSAGAAGRGEGQRGAGKKRAGDRAPGPRAPGPSCCQAGLGGPSHTPPRGRHRSPSVRVKADRRLALACRIVLEVGLFIPKKIIKSHVQKWGRG